jgi:hypothetical protein
MTSQDYAELAEHSYDRAGNMRDLKDQEVTLEGVTYKVLEHVDNPRTGYQGTIYQRVDSGEIIVAHRGTEFERERWKDLVLADGAMVLARVNPQAADAIALTARAREHASAPEVIGQYGSVREVTVTGHSLGGTLAQISAHYYDLRGETFNAYGAVSLHHQIPKGGDRVINHVTAADLVSSGSQHYGQVRVYAMPQEIEMLQGRGYANNDSRVFDPRSERLGPPVSVIFEGDRSVYAVSALMRGDRPPTVEGMTTAQTLVLGLGTSLGVVAMTLCLVPQLRGLGWRIRFRWARLRSRCSIWRSRSGCSCRSPWPRA